MIIVNWTNNLLPEKHKDLDLLKLRFKTNYYSGHYVNKGDCIGTISDDVVGNQICSVEAPESGYIKFASRPPLFTLFRNYPPNSPLFTIRSLEEMIGSLDAKYKIIDDPFMGCKHIEWDKLFETSYPDPGFYRFDPFVKVSFNYDGKAHFFLKIWRDKFKPKIKDSVSVLFVDKEVRSFTIKNGPIKDDDEFIIDLVISESDLDKLINVPVDTIRLDSKNSLPFSFSLSVKGNIALGQAILCKFAKRFSEALDEIGFRWETNSTSETNSVNEPCYVYLMIDTANGYHKSGISNHPEDREGTLQSEKPTIELLCAKQFPSRTIAKAIESALHQTYENKHLRGEWFQLEAKDIIDLMETLK